ncbi:MAG: hypothetical protein A2145_03230 [candidate division Zixibacteria bacterium RBG_16_40_9]|nr:MAG: hypothetical protein A2145_03230 [candidate division Zixibacteria bacterium RBG_16_40_9]
MEIFPVRSSKELKEFILLPWKVYEYDPDWVPPLVYERKKFFNKNKNPFFKHSEVEYFLARENSEVIGRIAAIVNFRHNQFHLDKVGFFGHFEVIRDYEAAFGLLNAAKDWLKYRGMEVMRGPANFSTNDDVGLLIEGLNQPPVIMMPYNPGYYIEFVESFGLRKVKDLYSYFFDPQIGFPENMLILSEKFKKKGNIVIRNLNLKKLDEELEIIKEIYNAAWSNNWGFVPLTEEEIDFLAQYLKSFVDPNLVFLAFVNGKPAGFSLSLWDINQVLIKTSGKLFPFGFLKIIWNLKVRRAMDRARVIILGVTPEFQKKGIELIFFTESFLAGVKRGCKVGDFGWILEDNLLIRKPLEKMGAKVYKVYRMYEMEI